MLQFIEDFPIEEEDEPTPLLTAIHGSYYRCCRCKYPLAPASRLVTFARTHDILSESSDCTHIFLSNPFDWMKHQIDTETLGGKLACPRCEDNHYLGEYCWLGVQCQGEECAEIMSPGLALLRRFQTLGGMISGVELCEESEGM